MRSSFKLSFLCVYFMLASNLYSHGMDEPGPHKGVIRMPGAFHTEAVMNKHQLLIYLLDINFKNPTVKDSKVEVKWKQAQSEVPLLCLVEQDHFVCDWPKGANASKGQIMLNASREKGPFGLAVYDLPLKAPHAKVTK